MAPEVGYDPTVHRLTADCVANYATREYAAAPCLSSFLQRRTDQEQERRVF